MKFSTAIMLGAALVLSGCNASTEGGPGESPPQASGESMRSNDNFPQPWWRIYGNKSASFYRSLEGRQMADNMLTWQNADGGWPLMTTWREPFTGDESRAGPWGRGSALVKSSVNEIRFLARAYAATGDDAYKAAAEAGIVGSRRIETAKPFRKRAVLTERARRPGSRRTCSSCRSFGPRSSRRRAGASARCCATRRRTLCRPCTRWPSTA